LRFYLIYLVEPCEGRGWEVWSVRFPFTIGPGLLVALAFTFAFATAFAAQTAPLPLPLTVSSEQVVAGQTIHVSVAGLASQPIAGKTGCLGVLGPGQNVELNLSPAFRPQIGMLSVAVDGTGQTDAVIPANLVPGSYRLIFGGCSPNGTIAPLATLAQATIQVLGSASTPSPLPKLPATGGVPSEVVEVIAALGALALILGIWLRRRSRGRWG
jgi:hypothetical protein